MATCSSCGLTLTWSVAAGAVFYRLVMLKFCGVALMQAATTTKGTTAAQCHLQIPVAFWLLLRIGSLSPFVPVSLCPFFGQHCRRVTFEDLLQLWRQLWLRVRPMLCLRCALCGFLCILCAIYCRSSSSSPHLPSLPLHSPLHYNVLVVRQADSCRCCTT